MTTLALPALVSDWPEAPRTKHAKLLERRLRSDFGIAITTTGSVFIRIDRLVPGLTQDEVMRVIRRVTEECACEIDPRRVMKARVGG